VDKTASEGGGGVVSTSGSEPTTAAVGVSSGKGKGGKGGKGPQLKKQDASSSVDERGISSESLSTSGGSRGEGGSSGGGGEEENGRKLQRKANSGDSPSDDAMLTGGSNSPPISGEGSDQFNRADSGSGGSSNGRSPNHEESLLG